MKSRIFAYIAILPFISLSYFISAEEVEEVVDFYVEYDVVYELVVYEKGVIDKVDVRKE